MENPLDFVRKARAVFEEAWDDEGVMDRLMNEPRTVLAEHGIELPPTVEVEVDPYDPAKVAPDAPRATIAESLARWDRMIENGRVILIVPPARPAELETRDLADEELERVSGGAGDLQLEGFAFWND
jgi:hypothetical protein